MKFINILLIILAVSMQIGCKTQVAETVTPVEESTVVPTKQIPEVVADRISLSWENTTEPHPERSPWSDKLVELFKQDFSLFISAKDLPEICPKFATLSEVEQLKALGEFMVATAYFESGYNPKSEAVDVGTKSNKETWSVGLYQMSGTDSSAKAIGATYEKLKDPVVNIEVAMIQMKKQITNRNAFFLNNSDSMRYWAVLLKGNKYSKINEIKARVLKNAAFCK